MTTQEKSASHLDPNRRSVVDVSTSNKRSGCR
nr:MAG TPA: hypothetical protein [Caudoviricetes sp.]